MYIPVVEEDIPLPDSAYEAFPPISVEEEVCMRARTIKLLSDITGHPVIPEVEDQEQAVEIARQMIQDPAHRPDFATYPSETMAYLAGMIAQTNVKLVDELSDLKMYVVNRLVYEIEHAKDSKTRISALAKLGEVDGVDAFKKRTEMTIQVRPIEEVEKELLETLNVLETRFIELEPSQDA
jgi:hypothetical protein